MIFDLRNGTIEVTCHLCQKDFEIPCTQEQLDKWYYGKVPIQLVMPNLKPGQRELLISGTCGDCFDNMFAEVPEPPILNENIIYHDITCEAPQGERIQLDSFNLRVIKSVLANEGFTLDDALLRDESNPIELSFGVKVYNSNLPSGNDETE